MILAGLRMVHDNCKLLEEQGGISMFRKLVIGALGAMAVLFSTTAFAQGTAADAKAMLEKTVAAIKADKAKTLDQINKGENGFLVGDIYPFCFNLSDGNIVALGNPNVKQLLGTDSRMLKDPTGKVYGQELYSAAKEGQVNEVSYMSPKAGPDKTWVPKVSFVTAVAGLGCGVGYYK
jgi:signal transduction histidine kinase